MNNRQGIKVALCNGELLLPEGEQKRGTVFIDSGKIVDVAIGDTPEISEDWTRWDAQGLYISPGFIDIHLHGGGGHDFMDGSVEAFLGIAQTHARYGTTAMYPTTLTSEIEGLDSTLENFVHAKNQTNPGAKLMAMHLEGPYFAVNQRGAQDPRYIRDPDPKEYRGIVRRHGRHIARWSAAPERPGAMEFADFIAQHGILPAIAHTDAVFDDVVEGMKHGYRLVTHLYSAMSGVSRRQGFRFAGVIESALLFDDLWVELIADGIHVPAPLLKLVYKVKGPERIVLITDAMRGAGMPEGPSILGSFHDGLQVIVEDGVAKLPDRTAFAGSVATGIDLIRTMVQLADVPVAQAVRMASQNPAQVMGVENKGRLVKGMDADLVLFDKDFAIELTLVEGALVYHRNEPRLVEVSANQ
ncbi:MAG: N-acetylglucosamine-6-phosphate deacetylase [Sphingobacterium sp.]